MDERGRFIVNDKEGALADNSRTYTKIITDAETGVQYLLAGDSGSRAGLTVLVDRDGKPLLDPTMPTE